MPDTAIVVPARLASQRFPRKLLHPVRGKPLVLWTAERIRHECPDVPLFFAVGDTELADVLRAAGFSAILTNPDLPSGSDRIAAANREIGASLLINVQADEPLVTGKQIRALLDGLQHAPIATVACRFPSADDFCNPNHVKVLCDDVGKALYFSRATIPFNRSSNGILSDGELRTLPVFWHQGLYAYDSASLDHFVSQPPSSLELCEKLEQLRPLQAGVDIHVTIVDHRAVGIDTPTDIIAFEAAIDG